jgi:Bacterial regulatory helix-turn-helix protein, lysR family
MAFDGRILAGVSVLAAVVEGGSFVKAANLVGITASGVSRAIGRLEARLASGCSIARHGRSRSRTKGDASTGK